jgi:hypothetical protein
MYRPQCDESRIETSETLYLGFAELSESTGEGHSPALLCYGFLMLHSTPAAKGHTCGPKDN